MNHQYHTLTIWLEMEFTSDIFLETSVCADYSQTILNKSNQYLYNQNSIKNVFEICVVKNIVLIIVVTVVIIVNTMHC